MQGIATGAAYAAANRRIELTYDSFGRRLALNRTAGATLRSGTSLAYDPASRLQALTNSFAGGTGNVGLGFLYNPASQMVSREINNDAYIYRGDYNIARTYGTNGLNQYATAGPRGFEYDANGNVTADKDSASPNDASRQVYLYDVENRLVKATGPRPATLIYDPLGRLFEVSVPGAATKTQFHYDGDALVGEYSIDTGTSAATQTQRYVHGPGVDEPLLWYSGAGLATLRTFHANHQGSIIAIGEEAGGLNAIKSYDANGIPDATNATLGRFSYTGQIWLPELKLYHYKARAYSPTLGRFLQVDPIGYKDQQNLYAYVGNDPVNAKDPKGKWCLGGYGTDCPTKTPEKENKRADQYQQGANVSGAVGDAKDEANKKLIATIPAGAPGGKLAKGLLSVPGPAGDLAEGAFTYSSEKAKGKSTGQAASNTLGQVGAGAAGAAAGAAALGGACGGHPACAAVGAVAGGLGVDLSGIGGAVGDATQSAYDTVSDLAQGVAQGAQDATQYVKDKLSYRRFLEGY